MKGRCILFIVFLCLGNVVLSKKLKEGTYRAVLVLNEDRGVELPFNFDVTYKGKKPVIIIRNADERITVDEIRIKGDSVNFKMPVFDTEFRTVLVGNDLRGVWINNYRTTKNRLAFRAVHGESHRFETSPGKADPVFEGKWEVTFSPGSPDSVKAIGVFHHVEQTDLVTGTFLTETGDYRYLEGVKTGTKLLLSGFDGGHAYLFVAEHNGSALVKGRFYSGAHLEENWAGHRNNNFRLADAEEITHLKNADEKINFTFPNLDGQAVSLSDKKFVNKPVILQLMGSWCPNCMDESAYLSDIYTRYKPEGLEIIALAFEKTTDAEKAARQVTRLKKRFNITYEMLVTAQTGKDKAGEIFPGLSKISAFPTTIFLDRRHQVVKIHTGFSGPATGQDYETFKQRTENLIKQLTRE